MSEWPVEATTYPVDDVVNPREIAIRQAQHHENLHNLSFQVFTDWCLTLGAAWGFHTDQERVQKLKADTEAKRAKDASSGMVLMAVLGSIIIGSLIFIPKILDLFSA